MSITDEEFFKLQEELMQLKTQKYEAKEREEALHREISHLKSSSSSSSSSSSTTTSTKDKGSEKEIARLRGILDRQNTQTIKLNAEVRVLRSKLKTQKSEENLSAEPTESDEDEIVRLGKEISDALVGELNEEKKKYAKLLRQNEELKKKVNSNSSSSNLDLEKENDRLKKHLSRVKDELDVAQQDRGVILSAMAEKDLQMDGLRDQISSLEEGLNVEKKKTDNLRKTLKTLRSQSTQMQESHDSLKEAEELTRRVNQLQETARTNNGKIGELERELQKTREERDKFREERENLQVRYQKDVEFLSSQTEMIETRDQEKEDQLKDQVDEYKKIINEIKESNFRALETSQEEHFKQLEQSKQCYLQEIDFLKEEFGTKEDEYKKELDLLREYEPQNKNLTALIRKSDEERREMETKLKASEEKFHEVEDNLRERQTKLEVENLQLIERIESLTQEHTNKLEEITQEKDNAIQEMRSKLQTIQKQSEEREKEMRERDEKLKAEVKDYRTQILVNEKKSRNLIRELQSQVQREKLYREKFEGRSSSSSSLSSSAERRSTDFENDTGGKEEKKEIRKEEKKRSNPDLAILEQKELEPKGPDQLQREILHLSKRLGILKGKNFEMEEKNRFLRENIVALKVETDKKDKIIQEYLVKMKTARSPVVTQKPFPATYLLEHVVSQITGEITLTQEVYSKTISALEETMLQNIQLRKDMEFLGNEVERFQEENKVLKNKIRDISEGKEGSSSMRASVG